MTDPTDLDSEIAAYLAGSNGTLNHGALTDLRNAERLIRDHGRDLHYCHPWARWVNWDDTRWADDNQGHTDHLAKETIRQLLRDAAGVIDDKQRQKAVKDIIQAERANRIRGMLELARSEPGVPVQPHQLDADPWLLNAQNGTVDLRTGQLREHRREDLLTKLVAAPYHPDAQAPLFRRFLERVLPDPELRHFIRRAAGYTLTGQTTEQILLILYGSGSNGKSTLTELLLHLMGDYGQQTPPETFLERRDTIPNDVAALRGARFVLASEVGEGRRLNEALVKRMTGGDTMTARFMRSEFFQFQPQFTPWLATNHRPEIRGTDHAIWRRVKLVPFNEEIPDDQQDHDLKDKLRAELPGVLAWAIRGCLDWQTDGLQEPDIVKAATAEYRGDMDILGGFLEDACTLGDDERATAADLYRAYQAWAKTNGNEAVTAQTFGRRLSERGFQQHRDRSGRRWIGLSVETEQTSLNP